MKKAFKNRSLKAFKLSIGRAKGFEPSTLWSRMAAMNRIWHVPRRNLQQAQWRPMNNVGRHKVAILADDDAPFRVSQAGDVQVAAAVLVWQIQRVNGIVPCTRQGNRELYWQLRINDELHAARSSTRLVCVSRAA